MKNSSSPAQTGAAGKTRNTQMLEDVDELMLPKPWCDHAESAISPFEETDIAAVHSVFDAQNFSLLLSGDEEMEALRSLSSSIDIPTTCKNCGKPGHWVSKECLRPTVRWTERMSNSRW